MHLEGMFSKSDAVPSDAPTLVPSLAFTFASLRPPNDVNFRSAEDDGFRSNYLYGEVHISPCFSI
jgi:hypothetical protein